MGKQSRKKKERRSKDKRLNAGIFRDFSTVSLTALLEAASASPGAVHRAPTTARLFNALMHRHSEGTLTVSASHLNGLADAASAMFGSSAMVEDFVPHDGRSEVIVRWGGELFRLLSGSVERPTALVRQYALLAEAIDPTITPIIGFGLFDAGELLLRRIDGAAQTLAPCWSETQASEIGDPPAVSDEEMRAAQDLPALEDFVSQCTEPERAAHALSRYTTTVQNLSFDVGDPISTFGTAIAVRRGKHVVPIPVGQLPEAFTAISVELAKLASTIDPKASKSYAGLGRNRLAQPFLGLGHTIAGPIRIDREHGLHSLVFFNDRQVLAIDFASGLTSADVQVELDVGARALAKIRPGSQVSTPGGEVAIHPDAEIQRVQVVAAPLDGAVLIPRYPLLRLEDVEWIAYSSQSSLIDLWYFVRDLAAPRGLDAAFAWDIIDRWEVWKPNRSFYRGGVSLSMMMFEPHASLAEWNEAARLAPIERAAHALKLPSLSEWPIVNPDHRRGVELGDLRSDEVFQIMPWEVPVAVAKNDSSGPSQAASLIWSLGVGIAWKLDHARTAFVQSALKSGVRSLRVVFRYRADMGEDSIVLDDFDGIELVLAWGPGLSAALEDDSFVVEELCGVLVSQVLVESERAAFTQAWNAAPPGIRMDPYFVRQKVQRLPDPVDSHDSVRSDVLRDLGSHIVQSEINPGVLHGPEAMSFETEIAFPWLLERFHETVARWSQEELLEFALFQIECVHHKRFMLDKRLGWEQGFPVQGESELRDDRDSLAITTRVVSFILEEVLARPSAGIDPIDSAGWVELLSVAELCIESCFRSDSVHRRLRATAVRISDLYEVEVEYSDAPTDVDVDAYNWARARATLPAAVAIGEREPDGTDDEFDDSPFTERRPEFNEIDVSMRSELGFGIDAMFGVLNVAAQWDGNTEASAARTTVDALVSECEALVVGGSAAEYRAAVDWMTLRALDLTSDVIAHWETERRRSRLLTRPFVLHGEDLFVLPWTVESTQRVVVAYLTDGRLPWPKAVLPAPLTKVLDKHRQLQNDELERDCVAILKNHGLIVRLNIRPQKASHYGIANLSGEIDVLCIDVERSRIWVIEAKDPYTPYSARQIRQLVDQFEKSGKYVDRLLGKVDDVARCAVTVAQALGVDNAERGWVVCGLMATRHVLPSAFVVNRRVPYCVVDDLLHIIDQDEVENLAVRASG